MNRNIVFLRAINVGGRRIKMDRLQQIFCDMGFENVQTYLASGNVIFGADKESAQLEEQITDHLLDELGYSVPAFVRTATEVAEIVAADPFGDRAEEPNTKVYIAFLNDELSTDQRDVLSGLKSEVDDFIDSGRELYWLRRVDAGESIPTSDIEKALNLSTTRRTFRTVERIARKADAPPS